MKYRKFDENGRVVECEAHFKPREETKTCHPELVAVYP